jgi:hypothetical protein
MMPLRPSIRIGLVKPNSVIEAAMRATLVGRVDPRIIFETG